MSKKNQPQKKKSTTKQSSDSEVFLSPAELAQRWGVKEATLAGRRSRGMGPAFSKPTRTTILYPLSEVIKHEIMTQQNP